MWIFLNRGCFAVPTPIAEPNAVEVGWHGTFKGIEFSKSLLETLISPMYDSWAVTTPLTKAGVISSRNTPSLIVISSPATVVALVPVFVSLVGIS